MSKKGKLLTVLEHPRMDQALSDALNDDEYEEQVYGALQEYASANGLRENKAFTLQFVAAYAYALGKDRGEEESRE